jgi:hypothetical protein
VLPGPWSSLENGIAGILSSIRRTRCGRKEEEPEVAEMQVALDRPLNRKEKIEPKGCHEARLSYKTDHLVYRPKAREPMAQHGDVKAQGHAYYPLRTVLKA